jgi:hypothetical protein
LERKTPCLRVEAVRSIAQRAANSAWARPAPSCAARPIQR